MWRKRGDERWFKKGRDGDHAVTLFQCDTCIFRLLAQTDPAENGDDAMFLCAICRVNLDALWGREPTTVYRNALTVSKMVSLQRDQGIRPLFTPLGPFPDTDVLGYGVAVATVLKSLEPRRYAEYTQWETCQKLCSEYFNAYLASAAGVVDAATVGQNRTKSFVTRCPTQSLWYEKFSLGCTKRMGQITKQDLAISIEVLHELLRLIEEEAKSASGSRLHLLVRVGAFAAIAFGGSF